jgi:hypothetical protein
METKRLEKTRRILGKFQDRINEVIETVRGVEHCKHVDNLTECRESIEWARKEYKSIKKRLEFVGLDSWFYETLMDLARDLRNVSRGLRAMVSADSKELEKLVKIARDHGNSADLCEFGGVWVDSQYTLTNPQTGEVSSGWESTIVHNRRQLMELLGY